MQPKHNFRKGSPMFCKSLVALCCVVALLGARSAAHATTLTTAHGDGMDSTLHEDNPTTPLGSHFELELVRNPGAGSRAFLLRFDLSEWLPGSFSGTATLELTNYRTQGEPHTAHVYGVADGAFGDALADVDEASVTWSTAPGLVPDAALGDDEDVAPASVFLGSFEDGAVEGAIDRFSTPALLHFLNADTNGLVVFLLTTPTPGPNGQVYTPKEATSFSYRPPGEFAPGSHAPRLTFTATALPGPTVLAPAKDSFLRAGAVNTNEGANPFLRVQAAGRNRVVVAFDLVGIDTARVTSATLIMTIVENADNWGPDNNRTVAAHPLLVDFTEGNGKNAGVPGAEATRGNGSGVTWACATDSQIANQRPDCSARWDGGTFGPATALPVVHTNGQSGEVQWDVTADVVAGATGWVIKKTNEGQSGQVAYSSKEGTAPPQLILTLE